MISRSCRVRPDPTRLAAGARRGGPVTAGIGVALVLVACASTPPPDPDPAAVAGRAAATLAIAPLNLTSPLPPQLIDSTGAVAAALRARLDASGKSIRYLDARGSGALWLESIQAIRAEGGEESFLNAARGFAQRLAERIPFDALILADLYVQNARIHEDNAYWDRTSQKLEFVGQSKWPIEPPATPTIEAASVLVHVFDRRGELLHTRRTGIELIQHYAIQRRSQQGHDRRTWVPQPDVPAIGDETRVRASVAHTLAPFLPE
jgi:hypothetical protein